jgi:putative hydrolase of the HAD superfamily
MVIQRTVTNPRHHLTTSAPRVIRTIFFDFGNVIAFFDHSRAVNRLLTHTDLRAADLLALYDRPLVHDYETGKLSTEEFVQQYFKHARLTCTPDEFLTYFCDIFWRNDEVCDLVPRLKSRYRLVLASNTVDAHFKRYAVDYADVLQHFDHVVASHHAGARKPHPEFFAYAAKFAQAAPDECLFIDDLQANVETAARLGWKGIVYTPDGTLSDKLREAGVHVESR